MNKNSKIILENYLEEGKIGQVLNRLKYGKPGGVRDSIRNSFENVKKVTQNVEDTTKKVGEDVAKTASEVGKNAEKVSANVAAVSNHVKSATLMAGAAMAVYIISTSTSKLNKALKGRCSKYKGREYKMCYMAALDQQIGFLKSNKGKCGKSKDPAICKDKIDNLINKLTEKRQNLFDKIK